MNELSLLVEKHKIMKKVYTFLSVAVCLLAASCVKQVDGGAKGPGNPLQNFDWKTTKSVPVNIVSEDGSAVPVFIYNGTELVAGGYTPFTENITVSKSCTQLMASSNPLPASYFAGLGRSARSGDDDGVLKFQAGDNSQRKVQQPDKGHDYLYKQWEQTKRGGHSYVGYFVPWWNDSPAGAREIYDITLFADKGPIYDDKDNLLEIPHACETKGCKYYDSDYDDDDEYDDDDDLDDDDDEFIKIQLPASVYVFEDLFPSMGDYDMNDFVVKQETSQSVWPNNKVKSVRFNFTVKAAGSAKIMGMAVRLFGMKEHDVESITMYKADQNGKNGVLYSCTNTSGMFNISGKGLEVSGRNDEIVIPIFENFFDLIPASAKGFGFNTQRGNNGGVGDPISFIVEVVFDKKSRNIKTSDFDSDLFIMPRSKEQSAQEQRGNEIHVADAGYTSKMNTALFGTGDDASVSMEKCFRAKNGYVWAICLDTPYFDYPLENEKLDIAYKNFNKWIETSGQRIDYQNWFKYPTYGKTWDTSL